MELILDLIFTTLFDVLFDEIVVFLALAVVGWVGFGVYKAMKAQKSGTGNV